MSFTTITPENAAQLQPLQQATRGWISQLSWSPNGRLLACSSAGGVGIWRGSLEDQPVFIKQHDGPVKGVAFAPNGAQIATASADTTVKLWDLRAFSPQMTPLEVFTDFDDAVEAVLIAGNGAVIAAGVDGTVRVLRRLGGMVLRGHTDEVNTLAISYDHSILASGGHDQTIHLWDMLSGRLLGTIEGHDDWVRVLHFHPRANILLSASRDHSARLWDITDPAHVQQLAFYTHSGDVRAAAFDATGDLIATGAPDGAVQLWQAADGTHLATLAQHTMPVVSLAFHPQNNLLASGSGDNLIRLWGLSEPPTP